MDIVGEALVELRHHYEGWLTMLLTTDAERELATLKIAAINRELARRSVSSNE